MTSDWLQSLKAGDEVIVYSLSSKNIATVRKVTATQIVLDKARYRKSDGREITSNMWHRGWLSETNDKDVAAINLRNAKANVRSIEVDELTHEQCDAILAIAKGATQ